MESIKQKKLYWSGIIGLFILLLVAVSAGNLHLIPNKFDAATLLISRCFFWFISLLTFIYANKIESGKLLIWEERNYTFGKSALLLFLTIVGMYGVAFIGAVFSKMAHLSPESARMNELLPIFRNSPLLLIFTCLTAGFTEEILLRGYMMSRLENLLKSPVAAIIISSVLFAVLHAGWGTWIQIIAPLLIGLVLAYVYWKYRNIKINIIAHFLFDLIQLLLIMKIHK